MVVNFLDYIKRILNLFHYNQIYGSAHNRITIYKLQSTTLITSALDSFEIFCPGHQKVFPIEHVITTG